MRLPAGRNPKEGFPVTGKANEPHARVFGPVPSRRLGRSLGVDIIPRKVCTLDCVYCQVGRTTEKTLARRCAVAVEGVVEEVRGKLSSGPRPDYITLAGSGEPTLCQDLGALICGIHNITDVPVAVLTNGTLFWESAVREACTNADLVLPSLDAGDEETFQRINRPADGLTLERVVQGLIAFRNAFVGQIWLEVFLVAGLNDDENQIVKIRALAQRMRPDKIQLNTAVRPTADEDVAAVSEARLQELCGVFGPAAEVIADFDSVLRLGDFSTKAEDILEMIRRRPVTVEDIAAGTGAHPNEVLKYVEVLLARGVVVKERRGGRDFLRAV